MSFVSVAVGIGFEGVAANIVGGAMMGGAVKVGTNVISGKDAFDDIGKGVLMGGLTGGLTPGVAEAFNVSMPMAAGITQGGLTALATGDLSKGLMAGMGAYGMYGLSENLGGGASGSNIGTEQAFGDVQAVEGSLGDKFNSYLTGPNAGTKPFTDSRIGTGNFLKDNFKYAAMAAGPIMADLAAKQNMPQTVTQPGMIRPYSYDPYSGGFTAGNPYEATPTRAAGGGLMGMDNGGYSPGQLDFTQKSEPVVRMASGGIAGYAAGGYTQEQINAALAAELGARGGTSQADLTAYAKSQYGLTDAQINAAYDTIPGFNAQGKYDAADYTATHVAGQTSPQMVVDAAAAANPYSAQNMAKVDTTRPGHYVQDPSGNYVALTGYSPGFDINNPTALTYLGELSAKGGTDSASQYFNQVATPAQKAESARLYGIEKARLDALDVAAGRIPSPTANAKTDTGLAGLNVGAGSMMPNANTQVPKGLAALDTTTKALNNATTGAIAPPAKETELERANRLFRETGSWEAANTLRTQQDTAANALRATQDAAAVADPNYWTDKKGLAALDPGASDTTKWYAARGLGFDPIDKVIDNFLVKYKTELDAMLPKEKEAALRAALDKEKLNEADVIKATGKTIAQLSVARRADDSIIVPGNLKDVPVGTLPGGVSGAGDTQINANGTITTKPDLTGLTTKTVRDTYTQGGGSLGYTSPTYTPAEFKAKYEDKLTGGSADAYNYLTGKTKYSPIPSTPTGEVMKPYAESVLGIPTPSANKKYIFDPTTKTYKVNPDYAIPTYDSKGVKSSNLTNADVKAYMDKKPSQSDFYTWATTNNLSPEQIAAASERPINEISKLFTGAKALTNDKGEIDQTKVDDKALADEKEYFDEAAYLAKYPDVKNEIVTGKSASGKPSQFTSGYEHYMKYVKGKGSTTHSPIFKPGYTPPVAKAGGGLAALTMARGGMAQQFDLGGYSDGGRLLRGPGDGVSDSIPATIGNKRPARLADGEFVVPARIVSELGNGSTEAGARKLYAMMDRVQAARRGSIGKGKVAKNSRADKYLPA